MIKLDFNNYIFFNEKLNIINSLNQLAACSLLIISVFALTVPVQVLASEVTFRYEGQITQVDSELADAFSEGDSFTGTYSFSTVLPDDFNPRTFQYGFEDGAHWAMSLT